MKDNTSIKDYFKYPLDVLAYCFKDETISKLFMCLHGYKTAGHSTMLIQALGLYAKYRGSNLAEFLRSMPYNNDILSCIGDVKCSSYHMNVILSCMLDLLTPEIKDEDFYNTVDRDIVLSIFGLYDNHIHHIEQIDLPFIGEPNAKASFDIEGELEE